MLLQRIGRLISKSAGAWVDDGASSMGAALAYYALFSIAPLLMIAIAVAGLVYGEVAARGEIVAQIQGVVGPEGALAVQGLLKSASEPARSIFATVVSTLTLVFAATTVFAELQTDLDRIWRVSAPATGNGWWMLLRTRLLAFVLALGLALLLLASLVIGAAISAIGKWSGELAGRELPLHASAFCVSLAATTVLFAMIYKLMPRARIAWRDVWIGAAVTALLFEIGKFLIGLYLGTTGMASGFGAASSLVVLLVWVYYSAQIFLLGAEFTWVYAHEFGSMVVQAARRPAPRSGDE